MQKLDTLCDPKDLFSPKQLDFIKNANAKFNLAHGAVRSGKTVCSIFRFLGAVCASPEGTSIWIVGHTITTIRRNIIEPILNASNAQLGLFAKAAKFFPGNNTLRIAGKKIDCIGAKDEGAIGPIQGGTCDIMYCDEMTLYPDRVIQMILSRLSNLDSILFASMNPSHPSHICKRLINLAENGDYKYYSLHFAITDNPYLSQDFVTSLSQTLSGLFYRRYYLGEWCLAEGAIFDFFDIKVHTLPEPPASAEMFFAGIDFGTSHPFGAVILGYNSGRSTQEGAQLWVEKEYYWDPRQTHQQKTVSEFAVDLINFFEDYCPSSVYVDPSAAPLKIEMRRHGIRFVDANNDVFSGICTLTNLLKNGSLTIMEECTNLIREIQSYAWDSTKSDQGRDVPIKRNDDLTDALRYAVSSFLKGKSGLSRPVLDPDEPGLSFVHNSYYDRFQ